MNKYLQLLLLLSCYTVVAFVLPRNVRKQSHVIVNGMWPFGKSNAPSSSSSPWSSVEFQQALERHSGGNRLWEELDDLLRSQESVEERTRCEDILTGLIRARTHTI